MCDTYNRAKIEILNYITSFFLVRNYGDKNVGCLHDCYFEPKRNPIIGDLVALSSAPNTEWYLSWYMENKSDIHLLKSIETGKLCNWSNVSFFAMNRKEVDQFPKWRWTDKQYKFKDKWFRACYKKRDAYMVLPTLPEFKVDGSVKIGTRARFNLGEPNEKTFNNWKKVLVKDMLEFYDHVVKKGTKKNLIKV